ncbi:MAG: MlaD family protein [Acidobacteriota bacterium]
MAERTPYLQLGIFVVIGLLLLLVAIFLIGSKEYRFTDIIVVEAWFNRVSGLKEGAPVQIVGVEKGIVDKVLLPTTPDNKVRVVMKVTADARPLLNANSVARIKSQGFFGEKYIEIELKGEYGSDNDRSNTHSSALTNDHIVLRGEEARDMDKLADETTKALATFRVTAEEYREIARKINDKEGSIGHLLSDKQLYQDLQITMRSIRTSSAKLGEVVTHIRSGRGTLGGLVYGRELTPQISATIAEAQHSAQRLSAILGNLEQGQGTMGKLLQDEAMAEDLRATLKSGRVAAESLAQLMTGIEKGEGPLGALLSPNGKSSGGLGNTLQEAHSAVVQMNEVLAAAKSNSLLRGYFQDRGYWSAADLSKHQLDESLQATPIKEYTFNTDTLFNSKNYNAKLNKVAPLYNVGVYLMSHSHSLVAVRVYVSEVGKAEENLELSQARAYMIREYLAKNFPIDENKIKIKGYGEDSSVSLPPERGAGLVRISVYE